MNDNKALEYLLSQNVNILIPQLMEQPIKFNNKEIINTLINYSSQAYEIVDNKKHNAFHYAIKYSNDYVIDLLIDKINIQTKDFKNNNYLHYSIKHHNIYSFNKLMDLIKESNNYDIFNQTNNNDDNSIDYADEISGDIEAIPHEENITNEKIIKEVIVNLKNNFIHLNNHEKKMFLERFVKEIKVRKDGNDVVIDEVIF